jgi:hypothetical protein
MLAMNSVPSVDPTVIQPTAAAALAKTDTGTAANDDAAAEAAATTRNPLWVIAIAMACFFGAVAAIMILQA